MLGGMMTSSEVTTVDSVLTHSNPWTPKAMGYYRVWVSRGDGPQTSAAGDLGRARMTLAITI